MLPPLYAGITARLMNINGVAQVQKDFANGGYYKTLSFHGITSGSNGGYTAEMGSRDGHGLICKIYTNNWKINSSFMQKYFHKN